MLNEKKKKKSTGKLTIKLEESRGKMASNKKKKQLLKSLKLDP